MDAQSILMAVNTLIIAPIYFILVGIRSDLHRIQEDQRRNDMRIVKLETLIDIQQTKEKSCPT